MNTPDLARAVIARARAEGVTFIRPMWIQRSFSCGYAAARDVIDLLQSLRHVGRHQRGRGYPVTDPPKEPIVPTHIDHWIEQPPTSEGERLAKDWLDEFRKPAHAADHVWLESVTLTCLYEGERYRCVGASRMGDVWLSPNLKSPIGYEVRADVGDCSAWERSDAEQPRTARETRDVLHLKMPAPPVPNPTVTTREVLLRILKYMRAPMLEGPCLRWSLLGAAAGYGSGHSAAICTALGLDPDAMVDPVETPEWIEELIGDAKSEEE